MDYMLDNLRLDPDTTGCVLVKDDTEGVDLRAYNEVYHWEYNPNYP